MPVIERKPLYVAPTKAAPKPLVLDVSRETELDRAYDWLASRGITRETAIKAGVIAGKQFIDGDHRPCVGFTYRKEGRTYAVKWRAITTKAFTQSGAANTLYLSDDVEQDGPVTITEGECDCLALRQAGVQAVSVPNGAPSAVLREDRIDHKGRRFAYLGEHDAMFAAAEKVILATDADEPGQVLAEELARRIGKAKCFRAYWPDGCKDANETLIVHGPDVLKECIDNAQPWPVNGLYDAAHFTNEVDDLYLTGLAKGETTGFSEVDEIYTVMAGQLCVVTGIPSMGKSSFVDQLMVNLAKLKGWRFAVCSFENPPKLHIAKLCQLYLGKPFFQGITPRMDRHELARSIAWVKEHFFFLYQGDGHQSPIEDIVDRMRAAVLRYGIRGAVIDPANFVDRPKDLNETDWVNDALTKLKVFIMAHDLHLWFIAHPAKMYKDDDGRYSVPGGYSISGSAHWFNKADMGMTVHRPDLMSNQSDIHIWKARFNWIGKTGKTSLMYDPPTGRYFGKVTGEESDDWLY